jgi:hypothetical protein
MLANWRLTTVEEHEKYEIRTEVFTSFVTELKNHTPSRCDKVKLWAKKVH